jgi:hypothetical protein
MGVEYHEWSSFFIALEELLFNSGGLISFSTSDFRNAVERRYLKDPAIQNEYHSRLAKFFSYVEMDALDRKVEELPWQLEQVLLAFNYSTTVRGLGKAQGSNY